MGVGGQRHATAALPPGKTRYPLYRRLGGPQGRSGQVLKISPPTGIRSLDRPARSESLYRLSYLGPVRFTETEWKSESCYYHQIAAVNGIRMLVIVSSIISTVAGENYLQVR
jgi:hypothetical protein